MTIFHWIAFAGVAVSAYYAGRGAAVHDMWRHKHSASYWRTAYETLVAQTGVDIGGGKPA
jgi:hypothetical protein